MASTNDEEEGTTINETAEEVGGRKIPQCQPCSKNNTTTSAQLYCHDCKEFQCSECSAHHQRFALLSGHAIVDWKSKDPEEKTVNMFGFDKCPEHGNPVTIFCEDHDVFCCPTCGFSGHRLCEKAKEIHEFSSDVNECEKILNACNEKASEFMKILNEIGIKEESKVKEKVEALKAELILKINNDLKEALKDIQTLVDALKSSKGEEISKVTDIQDDLELWKNSLNTASEQGSHNQCFILCKSLNRKTTEYNELLSNKSYDNIPISVHAECHKAIETFIKSDEKMVKLIQDSAAIHETSSETLEIIPTTTKSSEVCPKDIVENTESNDTEQYEYLDILEIFSSENINGSNITGIDVLPGGRLLVVDNYKKKCLLLNENLQIILKKFNFYGKNSHPYDVCVYGYNRAVVTNNNYLYFLQIEPQNKITLKRKVKTQSCYSSITMFNCSMFLCSTYGDNNGPVCVVDFEGNEVRFIEIGFPNIMSWNYDFECSFSTYISTGIIVLTDRYNSKVHMLDIAAGTSQTVEDSLIQEPTMACVASDNTVFVCCVENDTIIRISPEGDVLQALSIGFTPRTAMIYMDENEKLVVSGVEEDMDVHVIRMYGLD